MELAPAETPSTGAQQGGDKPTVFREYPVTFTDSKGRKVTTRLEYRNGLFTWVAAGVICWIGGPLFFWVGLIPFCVKHFKDVYHIDPEDGEVVGVYSRFNS